MQSSREPDFFVADWRICPVLGRLERGDAAASVEPRSMQVLTCLARHAPNVVSKQRLIQEVWGDGFVTEEVLSHAVWELRKAFGDEAKNPRYIQTISRRGYRLLAPVTFGVTAEPLVPGSRIAHYEILELLGTGAMGEVYKARDQRLGRIVALKFLPADLARDPSARRRFLHEAQAVAQLDHPNVATIYEVGESEGGRAYLALAFYEGETLQRKLECGPLPLAEAVGIARQIAQGLGAAHQRQIVHRDVKPANIAVLPDGTVKLLDFGLAKMIGATSLTRLGASPGTPAYKSPEQTRGEKVDSRSDLWAVGVVLYEMVTGRQPFRGEYEQAVIYSILNETPKPLGPEFPSELIEVIDRALKKAPAQRYAAAEELKGDLEVIPLGEVSASRTQPRVILKWWKRLVGAWYREHRWDFSPEVARWIEQGDRLEWQGNTERILSNAEQAYRLALARDPENPLIKACLAALLCRMEAQFPAASRRQEIRQLTDQAAQDAPGHPMPWVARTKLLLLEGKALEAEQAARQAIKQDPKFDRGYTVLAEALIAQGQIEEALWQIRHGIEVGLGYGVPQRDYRSHLWGKWRPSAASSQRGEAAMLLEQLVVRDGFSVDEAVVRLRTRHGVSLSPDEVAPLAAAFPKSERRMEVSDSELLQIPTDGQVESRIEETERAEIADRLRDLLLPLLQSLPAEDRLILKLYFFDGFSMAAVARILHRSQKELYVVRDRYLKEIRQSLEKGGLGSQQVRELLDHFQGNIDLKALFLG